MKKLMKIAIICMVTAVAVTGWTAKVSAFTLTFTDPATGNNVNIDIPDDPGEAFDAVTKDMTRLLEQAGVAVDELVASVSGCLKDKSGKPMVGTMVFLVNFDMIPEPSYGVTAGETGVGLFSGVGFPTPKPGLQSGCYWIPVPPSIISSILSVVSGDSSDLTRSRARFYVYPVAPGYNFVPPAQSVSILLDGTFLKTPVENLGEIFSVTGTEQGTSQ